jgi:A/G-specific adenine glycosylase
MAAALSRRRGVARADGVALDTTHLRDFGARLRAWYLRNARDLPWRRTRDPYRILVSELMLQQTQVSRVLGFYGRFLKRFPSLEVLAAARPAQVREQWQGLGYYARARNLHKLSRWVTRDGSPHGGTLPSEPSALRELPGIGAYTAGAVASFAHEKRAALVDTNVARVLSRVFAPHLHPKRARDLTVIWSIAERALPRTGSATWTHNQALMELGALVCTARTRHCSTCPVRTICASYAAPERASGAGVAGDDGPVGLVMGGRGAAAAKRSRSSA